jgi:LCP family protein required for cell wall assembly
VDSHYFDTLGAEQRAELLREVHRRQDGLCFVCDEPIDLDNAGERAPELDHIQPLAAGGADNADNLALLHAACAHPRAVRDLRLARAQAGLDRVRNEFGVVQATGALASTAASLPEPAAPAPSGPSAPPVAPAAPTPPDPPAVPPDPSTGDSSRSHEPAPPIDSSRGPDGERSYGGALGLTVVGAVVPGTAYLAAGRRRLGLITVGIVVLLALSVVTLVLLQGGDLAHLLAELASRPTLIDVLGIALLVAAAAWIVVIATGHRMLLPSDSSLPQQIVGGALTLVLALAVAVPSVVAARYAFATHDLIEKVFHDAGGPPGAPSVIDRSDPWKDIPRLNLLIIGGDATDGGGLTTNTMIIASIDTATGEAVLIGVPRNLRNAPIPAENPLHAVYPDGFQCGDRPRSCLLSSLYTEAKVAHPDLFGNDPDAGLTTLRGSLSEITGLEINYSLVVDLVGFEQVVDALGGIDINVGHRPVPIADLDADGNPLPPDASTRYIPPGPQHLDGEEALAFTRERRTDASADADRMLRQRAVISAIVDRADPVNLLLSYLEVASTAGDAIRTDVPVELLPAFVDLAEAVQAHEIQTLAVADDVSVTNPDFVQIRELVHLALSR